MGMAAVKRGRKVGMRRSKKYITCEIGFEDWELWSNRVMFEVHKK